MIFVILISITLTFILAEMALHGMNSSKSIRQFISLTVSVVLHSLFFMACVFIGYPFALSMFSLLAANVLFIVIFNRRLIRVFHGYPSEIDAVDAGFIFYLLCATFVFTTSSIRWGGWDGWAIWNMHAKFLYFDQSWTNLFSSQIAWSHPDYPLLLPSLIAMFWKSIGKITPLVPILTAYAALTAVMTVLYLSLREKSINWIGMAGVALTVDNLFISVSASQYADTLLALFYLITIIFLYDDKDCPIKHTLIGLFAAMSMLIKNEGIAFFVIVSAVFIFRNIRKPIHIKQYIYGIIIPLSLTIVFKTLYAPVNDIISHSITQKLHVFACVDRSVILVKYLISITVPRYSVMALLIFVGMLINFKKIISPAFAVILLTFMLYSVIYLLSPYDINWHIRTSIDRLVHQMLPSLIYLGLLAIFEKRGIIQNT